jgi:hypothetical protein
MGKYENVEELSQAIDAADDGILLCEAVDLRDACGESRLKTQARERVSDALASRGLVALPEVPEYQEYPVYVARQSSSADLLFKAFMRPDPESLQRIRGAAGGTGEVASQQDAIKQIGELLDEARTELETMLGESEEVSE